MRRLGGGKSRRTRYRFMYGDKTVCRPAFMYINDIGNKALRNIQKHLAVNGPVPRLHGNTRRRPANAIKYEEARYCVDWIVWYADSHGLPMPAAPCGQGDEAPVFLPSYLTKKDIHTMYLEACHELGTRQLSVSSFKNIWSQCLPHIKIMTPKKDVCHKCEILRKKIADAVIEHEKLEASTSLTLHIQDAQAERQLYLSSVNDARNEMSDHDHQPGPIPPLSSELRKVHYTFDYSKNVLIPNHSNQMGPLYFVTARKLQMFGVRIDSTDEQFNYIIDEDQSIDADGSGTHGSNSVISMVHHCLFRRSFGEKRCVLHTDNCGSQNKNRFVIAYLLWRIHQGLNTEIVLFMAIPGHTKCLIDGGFGRTKKLYRRSDCDCLQLFAEVIEKSSTHNFPVLFSKPNGEHEYDWKTYIKRYFRPLNGIQKFHSFRVTAEDKTSVFVKERSAGEKRRIKLLKSTDDILIGPYPEQLQPAGLSRERQKYLFQHVRPFVRAPFKDITCPALADITEE